MLTHGARPRQLRWYHAGPMLFGDWGTSRLYVLGLALAYTHYAALWYMGLMSLLLIAVGWAYSVVCELYPDGGGVYAAAKERSQRLAVIGALLLSADYIVTASLSALEAFHYAGFSHESWWAAGAILLVGAINYFGPTKAGTFAIIVAVATIALSIVVAAGALPSLRHVHVATPPGTPVDWWRQFTSLILAISGVEAIANMTGIMVHPVSTTARRAIWPVVIEIVVLNLILTAAMVALPAEVLGNGDPSQAFTANETTMMRLLAEQYVHPLFASVASIVFSLLLLSAVNTAVTALVSIQFTLAEDRELPYSFGNLNAWGVPVVPLIIGSIIPALIVLAVSGVKELADLYAIGVVGAVAVNLGCVSTNWAKPLRIYQRAPMFLLALLMVAIWITIAIVKWHALAFAMSILGAGFGARYVAQKREHIKGWVATVAPSVSAAAAESVARSVAFFTRPGTRYGAVNVTTQTRILVATRNNPRLIKFALEEARLRNGEVLLLFVRHIAIARMGAPSKNQVAADPEAAELFALVAQEAEEKGVPVHFLYTMAYDVAEVILEMAVTYAVDYLILGSSQRGALWRTMKGDVIREVAQDLPERITLLLHG